MAMITKTFKQFGEIEINVENCDEILSEATQVMKLAVEVKTLTEYERMKSFQRSEQIKRGIKWKKENGYKRSEEFGASK